MPPVQEQVQSPVPTTPDEHSRTKPLLIVGGIAVVLLGCAFVYSQVGSNTVDGPQTDAACEATYFESSLPYAQARMQFVQTSHPGLTILEASLNVFYSPALKGCVIGNFARIQSTEDLKPEQFLGTLFEDHGETSIIGFFAEAASGRVLTPESPEWADMLQDMAESEARKQQEAPVSTPTNSAECEVAHGARIDSASNAYAADGSSVSRGLYFSDSLQSCIGIIIVVNGNQTDVLTFDAATGDMLNVVDSATAIEEYSALEASQ